MEHGLLLIDSKDISLIVQGLCCISSNAQFGVMTPEQLNFKKRVEHIKWLLEHDNVEKRFRFLSERYPEHRQELNSMFWRHDHLYRNLVNHYFSKYTNIKIT